MTSRPSRPPIGTLRIGIVGTDNSHALLCAKLINVDAAFGGWVAVTAITGADGDQTRSVAKAGQITMVVDSPQDLLGLVDAVLVVDRHGSLHADHAIPFVDAGLPVFIDKPFTSDLEAARDLLGRARRSRSLLTSYSTLRWRRETAQLIARARLIGEVASVTVVAPCDFASPYDGPFFYGIHAAEVVNCLVAGMPRSVYVARVGSSRSVTAEFSRGRMAVLALSPDVPAMEVVVVGARGIVEGRVEVAPDINAGLSVFFRMIRTGRMPLTSVQMLAPVALLQAARDGDKVLSVPS